MANLENNYQSNLDRKLFSLSLDVSDREPLQAQLLEALRTIILNDPSQSGVRFPASRTLAAELSVSRTTVQAVYDQLISEGYLSARRGSGTFIADDLPHLTPPTPRSAGAKHVAKPWRPFQTSLSDQSLLPHKTWARHLERAWSVPDPKLLARSDPLGWYPLREAIADHLTAWRQLDCEPEQVVITSGAGDSLELIFRGLFGDQTSLALEDPCWPRIHGILESAGTQVHPVRIDEQGFDAARIPDGVTAAIVTPSRHFPTGINLTLPRRMALLDWATRNGAVVIEDDYDSEFRYRGQPLPSLAGLDQLRHTIYLGSFSKLVSFALRIGYVVLPKGLLERARTYLGRVGSRASLVPQPALAELMLSGEFAMHLRRMRRIYAKRQNHLIKALEPVGDLLDIRPDPSGMHLCVPLLPKLKRKATDQNVCAAASSVGLEIGALSKHSILPDKPQALLLGYAAFDEETLSDASTKLITVLKDIA